MGDMRLAPGFRETLESRLGTPEGKEAMSGLIGLIAEAAAKSIPPELVASLDTPEGKQAFRELWPEIVAAYFRGLCNPNPKK
jgi:hypothetical protein